MEEDPIYAVQVNGRVRFVGTPVYSMVEESRLDEGVARANGHGVPTRLVVLVLQRFGLVLRKYLELDLRSLCREALCKNTTSNETNRILWFSL